MARFILNDCKYVDFLTIMQAMACADYSTGITPCLAMVVTYVLYSIPKR